MPAKKYATLYVCQRMREGQRPYYRYVPVSATGISLKGWKEAISLPALLGSCTDKGWRPVMVIKFDETRGESIYKITLCRIAPSSPQD